MHGKKTSPALPQQFIKKLIDYRPSNATCLDSILNLYLSFNSRESNLRSSFKTKTIEAAKLLFF